MVKVEDGSAELGGESGEQSALTHGARPGEDHDGLFAHVLRDDFGEPARAQPASSLHAFQDAMRGSLGTFLGNFTALYWGTLQP